MHGTAAQLTGLQIAYMLPIVFVGPIAGVFVDRWPLKPTLVASDLIRAGLALLLIPATSLWQVYVVLAALSCVSAFFGPAQTVTIRAHVPTTGLMSANALMQIAFMGSRIIGPATAGALVALFHADACATGIDVVSFLASAALIGSVAIVRPPSLPTPAGVVQQPHPSDLDRHEGGLVVHRPPCRDSVLRHRDGRRAVHDRLLRPADLDLCARHAARRARPVRIRQRHGRRRPARRHAGRSGSGAKRVSRTPASCCAGLVGIGVGVLLLGAVPHIAATLAATFTIGFAFAAIMVPAQTLIQRETPPDMLGRVGSTNASVVFLGQILGLAASGVLANSSACARCSSCAPRCRSRSRCWTDVPPYAAVARAAAYAAEFRTREVSVELVRKLLRSAAWRRHRSSRNRNLLNPGRS